ncbi:efflux RND transporter periplasmic adaptor subunit [Psychroflexus aestuariivivens]|uniref:efflux RND transporter periplasmic adaptor subunit n=1 Tax=Psychroflexus aestuariivivens TaxID=1795040 RepID=UPI000FD72820|nr:efflux RND transporter periplasmic adaptor subunit [Psychroflexus aestuariivivens]
MKNNQSLAILIIAGIFAISCQKGEQNQEQLQTPTLPVVELQQKEITTYKSYPTTLEGEVSSDIRAKVSGYITEVLVEEGEEVKKNQPLFKLETRSLSQDASSAQARVNAAQIEVNKLKPLVEKDIISEVQLETAEANLATAKSQLQSIQANIGYANINSPVDGYIGDVNFRTGALISPSDVMPLTKVVKTKQVYAYFSVNESEYYEFSRNYTSEENSNLIKSLPEVTLIMSNGEEYEIKGKISSISSQVNTETGSVNFRATFENTNQILKDGASGTIKIPSIYKDAIVIPRLSTFERQGKVLAFQFQKDSVVERPLETISADKYYIIKSGLSAKDTIVAKGANKIKNGDKIKPQHTTLDSIVNSFDKVFK